MKENNIQRLPRIEYRPAAAELQRIMDGLSLARCSCRQWRHQVHTYIHACIGTSASCLADASVSLPRHREEDNIRIATSFQSLHTMLLSMGLDGIWTLKPLMNVCKALATATFILPYASNLLLSPAITTTTPIFINIEAYFHYYMYYRAKSWYPG